MTESRAPIALRHVSCFTFHSLLSQHGSGGGLVGSFSYWGDVVDFHLDVHRFAGLAVDGPGGRGGVPEVAAEGDADVVGLGEHAVGRVEALPADVGM